MTIDYRGPYHDGTDVFYPPHYLPEVQRAREDGRA